MRAFEDELLGKQIPADLVRVVPDTQKGSQTVLQALACYIIPNLIFVGAPDGELVFRLVKELQPLQLLVQRLGLFQIGRVM